MICYAQNSTSMSACTSYSVSKFTQRSRKFMTKFIKVLCHHLGPRPTPSNHITPVIVILCPPIHAIFILLHPLIYSINPCSKSTLPRPSLASPFRRIRDLWYTSTHVEKCTVSLAWCPDAVEGSILDNTDARSRPGGVSFRLLLLRHRDRSFSRQPLRRLIAVLFGSQSGISLIRLLQDHLVSVDSAEVQL